MRYVKPGASVADSVLILDANILIRGALGRRVRELLRAHAAQVDFFAPDTAFGEAREYLPGIFSKRGEAPALGFAALEYLSEFVCVVEAPFYAPFRELASERLLGRDPDDWPVLACALALECPVWTEDRDFFGVGVPVWTSNRVEIFLRTARR